MRNFDTSVTIESLREGNTKFFSNADNTLVQSEGLTYVMSYSSNTLGENIAWKIQKDLKDVGLEVGGMDLTANQFKSFNAVRSDEISRGNEGRGA
jgi:hypothetical protein